MRSLTIALVAVIVVSLEMPYKAAAVPRAAQGRFLRAPEEIQDLWFSLRGRDGWRLSHVVFGIRDNHLMMARFLAESPDGSVRWVDKSAYADVLLTDTSQLPAEALLDVGGRRLQILGFTIGRSATGEAYVDWVLLAEHGGQPFERYMNPPDPMLQLTVGGACRITSEAVCINSFCSEGCLVVAGDPCDCPDFNGFCFVDYYVYHCRTLLQCSGECQFLDIDNCAFVLGAQTATEGMKNGCN